jgi:phospholipid/cholesterol/gamma-HCH transport system substrate-binding protein
MQFDRGRKIRLGLFISLGTILFMAFFYLIGNSSKFFSKSVTLHTSFPSVSGLRSGDHVRFSGVIIGTVSDLEISTDTSVRVDMSIDRKLVKFIRMDSKVEIKSEALIGDKMLVVYSGTENATQVSEGDFLEPIESFHLEAIVHELSGDMRQIGDIVTNLVAITDKVDHGDGNVGRLLNDSSIAIKLDKSADNFVAITNNLKILTLQLNNPDSDLGKLISRDNLTNQIDTLMIKLDSIATNTNHATSNLALTSIELKTAVQAINTGNGLVNKLLYDSAFADTISYTIDNLNQTIIDLDVVAKNLHHKKLFGGKKEK